MRIIQTWVLALLLLAILMVPTAQAAVHAIGDTLTIIQRPLLNIPAMVVVDGQLRISCVASPAASGWTATLERGSLSIPLTITSAVYSSNSTWWTLLANIPNMPVYDLYDLHVTANGGQDDVSRNSVRVMSELPEEFYFVHITDTHLPTHMYYTESGAETDSASTVDLREITADVNLINPAFVLLTGDLINEGELEDYLQRRYYSRAQRQLTEFEVPVYLVGGNHDLGGWSDTPPSDGTARRDWWRFFGWQRLNNPPASVPYRTQDYSFDFGPVHFIGLESYVNYDDWRSWIYNSESFTSDQMSWLDADLAAASSSTHQVLFYHYDFQYNLDLEGLNVDMALWGHVHGDRGSITTQPYDLGTDKACDGDRSFRLIRFENNQLNPRNTLHAGYSGQTLRSVYSPDNNGTNDQVTVNVINGHNERFQFGQLRVLMPAAAGSYVVTGGTLTQVDNTGATAVCYVDVDIPANGNRTVTVTAEPATAVDDQLPTTAPRLLGASPNPFNPRTEISFELPAEEMASLTIFDIRGQEVVVLARERLTTGLHTYVWDGLNKSGTAMPSGVYFAGFKAGSYLETRKLTLVR